MITSTFPAWPGDGTPSFVADLGVSLSKRLDISVLAPRVRGQRGSWPELDLHRFRYFPSPWEGLADNAIVPALREAPRRWAEVPPFFGSMTVSAGLLLDSLRVRLINAHWLLPGGMAALAARRFRDVPIAVTAHGADVHALSGLAGSAAKRAVLRHVELIIPVSHSIRSALIELLPSCASRITEPVPMGTLQEPMTQPSIRSQNEFLIVARLAEKKGVETAVRAFESVDDARLLIIGDGPEMKRLKALCAQLQVGDRIRFLGQQTKEVVTARMRQCSAVVIPSVRSRDGDTDGTPVVLAEAMANGAPVIASAIGGLSEQIRHQQTGFLFRPGDVDQLAELVRSVIDRPELLKESSERAAQDFSGSPLDMNETARKYYELLSPLMSA